MLSALFIEVEVLVSPLLRQILYPENEQDDQRGGNGGVARGSRKPRAIFGIHNETVDSIGYVVLISSHLPC